MGDTLKLSAPGCSPLLLFGFFWSRESGWETAAGPRFAFQGRFRKLDSITWRSWTLCETHPWVRLQLRLFLSLLQLATALLQMQILSLEMQVLAESRIVWEHHLVRRGTNITEAGYSLISLPLFPKSKSPHMIIYCRLLCFWKKFPLLHDGCRGRAVVAHGCCPWSLIIAHCHVTLSFVCLLLLPLSLIEEYLVHDEARCLDIKLFSPPAEFRESLFYVFCLKMPQATKLIKCRPHHLN